MTTYKLPERPKFSQKMSRSLPSSLSDLRLTDVVCSCPVQFGSQRDPLAIVQGAQMAPRASKVHN